MITNRQKNFLVFFLSNSLFFGFGFTYIYNLVSNDSWIAFILGTILGILFTFIYRKIPNIVKIITSFILLILSIILIINFIKTYYLIKSNVILIILPIIFLCIYIFYKNDILIAKLVESIFPITFSLILISILSLIFKADFTNVKPFIVHSTHNIVKASLIYFLLTTLPLILVSDYNFKDTNILKSYLMSSFILIIISILTIGILGPNLIRVYEYPEYIILKEIVLFNFVEKIENILIIPWIINLFILLFVSIINIKKIRGLIL